MPIRILNCASMSPWWPHWHIGGLSLLVDTDQGPILVDTGLGLHDHESPSRMVRFFRLDFGIHDAPEETALRQVTRYGVTPKDIQHIVLTHLHFDHAGGLPDFPWAKIHLHRKEYDAMRRPRKWIEMFAYDPADVAHNPHWQLYDNTTEKWFDFDAIPLPFTPRMFLIPLFGHTSGHCGVAIQDGQGWLFQAGDSLPVSAQFDVTPAWVNHLVLGPHIPHLRSFTALHPEVRILAGHAWMSTFTDKKE